MTPGALRPTSASRSERGARDINEDAVLSAPLPDGRWLAAVADGMGGLPAGEAASRTALDALRSSLEAGRTLEEAVLDANRAVVRRRADRPMGTTLVAALFAEGKVRIANVGDSRAYLLGPLGLVRVTRDHTFASEAASEGEDTAREVAASRWGSTLTRSLGASDTVDVDEFGPFMLDDGVRVLLCSDGVHAVLDDREIEACLEDRTPEEAAAGLVDLCLRRGGGDNVSAIILKWDGHATADDDGTVRSAAGVSESAPDRGHDRGPGVDGPGSGTPPDAGDRRGPGPAPWDPARLARRAPRRRRRKPGRLRAALLVLALAGVVLLMLALLP